MITTFVEQLLCAKHTASKFALAVSLILTTSWRGGSGYDGVEIRRGIKVVHYHTASVTAGIPTQVFSTPNCAINGIKGKRNDPLKLCKKADKWNKNMVKISKSFEMSYPNQLSRGRCLWRKERWLRTSSSACSGWPLKTLNSLGPKSILTKPPDL